MTSILNEFAQLMSSTTEEITKIKTIGMTILGVVVAIGTIVCIIFLAINGVKLSKSEDDEQIALAKKRVKYCILGLVLCVAASAIGFTVMGLADKIFNK